MPDSNDYLTITGFFLVMVSIVFVLIPTIETAFNLPYYINQSILTIVSLMSVFASIFVSLYFYNKTLGKKRR